MTSRRSFFKSIVGAFVAVALDIHAFERPEWVMTLKEFQHLCEMVFLHNANRDFEHAFITKGVDQHFTLSKEVTDLLWEDRKPL